MNLVSPDKGRNLGSTLGGGGYVGTMPDEICIARSDCVAQPSIELTFYNYSF